MSLCCLYISFCSLKLSNGYLRVETLDCIVLPCYTLAEGIMISVRSLQCSDGDVSEHIKYINS